MTDQAAFATVLRHAETDHELGDCFAVMCELRPQLAQASDFVAKMRRQQVQGYRVLAAWRAGQAVGLAGYRLQENTINGRFVYVDDLVVSATLRRTGLGAQLLDAVSSEARVLGCGRVVLDTALGYSFAQRFYFRHGLLAVGMHFTKPL